MPSATKSLVNTKDSIKCLVIGDGAVGKTCLLISYAKGEFPKGYVPTVFDNYSVKIDVAGRMINLNLIDTAGQEDYDHIRPLSYGSASIFLLCFSVANRDSFENIREKWFLELRKASSNVPFMLVGTQADRRQSAAPGGLVSIDEAERMARQLGAIRYMECSALTREGLRDVFVQAVMTAMQGQPTKKVKKTKCSIF